MKTTLRTKKLVECALMVAVGTVLSLFSVVQMPYGGSVTPAAMLPVILIAYRHGLGWGLGSGAVFAAIQQLLGLNNLSYFTTWQSVVAVILLDYLLAFSLVGLGGVFRRAVKGQERALALGALLVSVLRYVCHTVAGATVWAGLSIPTEAALLYSLGYNATYMIPETIVLVLVAYYLGTLLDFRRDLPVRRTDRVSGSRVADLLYALAGLICVGGVAADAALIFSHLQNGDGEFDVSGLAVDRFVGSFWMGVTIVTVVATVAVVALLLVRRHLQNGKKTANSENDKA